MSLRLDIYGDMRYNLKRIYKKILAFVLTVFIALVLLTADCVAFGDETEISTQGENSLFLDASVSEGGGCIEVMLSSSRAACGVLATLSYDEEYFSFLTFVKSETLAEQVTVSCSDSNGSLRMIIDADENFEGGVWSRFFFSVNEAALNEPMSSELFFEISVSVESAYELSESVYDELCFEGSSVRLDLREHLDQDQTNGEKTEPISAQLIDFGAAFEKCCTLCISGCADREALAAGFEITVSCENFTESYTISRVLPITADDEQGYTVIILLPLRASFYVTVRAIEYSAIDIVYAGEEYCFFVSGSGIERVGLDR